MDQFSVGRKVTVSPGSSRGASGGSHQDAPRTKAFNLMTRGLYPRYASNVPITFENHDFRSFFQVEVVTGTGANRILFFKTREQADWAVDNSPFGTDGIIVAKVPNFDLEHYLSGPVHLGSIPRPSPRNFASFQHPPPCPPPPPPSPISRPLVPSRIPRPFFQRFQTPSRPPPPPSPTYRQLHPSHIPRPPRPRPSCPLPPRRLPPPSS